MPKIAQQCCKFGISIYNCNEQSTLKAFKFKSLTDAVAEESLKFGALDSEEVKGLYTSFKDKCNYTRKECVDIAKGLKRG